MSLEGAPKEGALGGGKASLARRMLHLADAAADDPEAAYLCLWTALTHLIWTHSAAAELRPRFGLRKNGTLRTRRIGGLHGMEAWKMPEIYPPREAQRRSAVIRALLGELKARLLHYAAIDDFVGRVPTRQGRPVTSDTYGQRPTGVLDLAATVDPRYPIWTPIDGTALRACREGHAEPEVQDTLLGQVLDLLETVQSNLVATASGATASGATGDANAAVTAHALPLLRAWVEGLSAAQT